MTTSCMGGWCVKRDRCAHYHAATEHQHPAERLCPPGQDGAGLQHLEQIDMTRPYISAEERRKHALAVLRDGISLAEVRDALGYAHNENAHRIMDALVYAGQAFPARAKVDPAGGGHAWTTRYFLTAEARDAFVAAKDAAIAERKRARKKVTNASAPYYEKRKAARKAARAERVQARAAEQAAARAQREALKLAEAEQRKAKARLAREAAEALKKREKAEAKKTTTRLKAETKAAGKIAKPRGTAVAAPSVATPKGPAHIVGELDLSRAKVTRAPTPPDRWAAKQAAPVISSNECRPWAEAVAA